MRLDDLLTDSGRRRFAAAPEADALTEEDALLEAYLVDLRADTVSGRAWLLFDCRGALQIALGNTAVLAVNGLRAVSWGTERRRSARTQWSIISWSPAITDGEWQVRADTVPAGQLELRGSGAEFFVGNVPGGDAPPPDFVDATDAELRAGLPGWHSEFEPVHATFLDPLKH